MAQILHGSLHPTFRRQRHILSCLCLLVLVLIWTFHYPATIPSAPLPHAAGTSSVTALSPPTTHPTVPPHPNDVDLSDPSAPFVAWPLARACAASEPVPGLVFVCDNNAGGPGNVRNYILTCVRYAVAGGAAGLVVPRIRARPAGATLAALTGPYRPLGYLFDEAHFRAAAAAACPRLALYERAEDVPHVRLPVGPPFPLEKVFPKDLGDRRGCDWRDQNRLTDRFAGLLRAWLDETAAARGLAPVAAGSPRLLRMRWGVLWDWPVLRDGPEFAATFGGLLRFRADVLRLAGVVEEAMREFVREHDGGGGGGGGSGGRDAFLGIHLRTENDALREWPSYEMQRDGYLGRLAGSNLTVAYLANGNATEADKFAAEARGSGITVTTKSQLLRTRPADLAALQALSWDQQALVDFVLLCRSDYFLGVSPSSFSINVALKRHLRAEGLYSRPWKVGDEGDGRSWLVGKYDNYIEDWMFMFDGMWP